jgi:hypothetical protein
MARCEENTAIGAAIRETFPVFSARIAAGCCPFCNKFVNKDSFKDALSIKEFSMSGMCQPCQDGFFVSDDE